MSFSFGNKVDEIFAVNDVLAVYLFGSQADGSAYPNSDYDFGVLLKDTPAPENIALVIQELGDSISETINTEVDITILNTANIEFRFEVISKGKVIYSFDEEKRTDFEDIAIRDYLDFKPFLDAYYRDVREAVREGDFYGE